MRIQGQQSFATSRTVLWSLIHEAFTLQLVIPGCQSIEATAADAYNLSLATRVGKVEEAFDGTLIFEDASHPNSFGIQATARNEDGAITCHGRVSLDETIPGATELRYDLTFDFSGRPGTISPRLQQTTARAMLRRSFEALERQVAIRTRVYTTAPPPPTGERPLPALPDPDVIIMRRRLLVVLAALLAVLLLRRGVGRAAAASTTP